jgi:hypothetical protein
VKGVLMLNLVGDFPYIVIAVALVAANDNDVARKLRKSFVIFFGHFLRPPLAAASSLRRLYHRGALRSVGEVGACPTRS